jgi:Gpi18-like mannosyltransferase
MTARGRSKAGSEGRWAVVAALGSRLLLAAVAVLTTLTMGVGVRALFLRDPAHAEVLGGFAKRLFEPWAHWDGVWFVRIAADGYAAHESSPAFFPLYPLLMHAVAPLTGGNYVVAGVVVSTICYAGAMVLLYRLAKAELGARVALWSVVFISVFPTALVFQAVYSESLFLLLALACFAAARRGHWLLAGVMGLLATLTRSSGLVLLLPLAFMWWEQRRAVPLRLPGGPAGRRVSARRPATATLACLLLVPAGLALYMAYLWREFGDPLLFGVVQGDWGRGLAAPWTAVWNGTVEGVRGIGWLVTHGPGEIVGTRNDSGGIPLEILGNVVEFVGLVVAVLLLVACWRKLPAAYTVYALAALLFPLFYPADGRPLSNLPRFVLVDFPLFIGLAAVLVPHRVARWAVAGGMLVLLVVATVYFASWS